MAGKMRLMILTLVTLTIGCGQVETPSPLGMAGKGDGDVERLLSKGSPCTHGTSDDLPNGWRCKRLILSLPTGDSLETPVANPDLSSVMSFIDAGRSFVVELDEAGVKEPKRLVKGVWLVTDESGVDVQLILDIPNQSPAPLMLRSDNSVWDELEQCYPGDIDCLCHVAGSPRICLKTHIKNLYRLK